MKNIQTKYKLNFKTMKKGLLTLLAASLVFVGCQNYDDQFDDLNAQISALKSQVDGLSSLSGQVSSLSGTISGLSAGVAAAQASADAANTAASSIDFSSLSAGLTTLQAEVDEIQASLATAVTAADIATLQAELDAIEADVDTLVEGSGVYTTTLQVTNAPLLAAAKALGNEINVIAGGLNVVVTSDMDMTDLQTVMDKIYNVTGNVTFTNTTSDNQTAITMDKLTSAQDVNLQQKGPYSLKTLVSARTLTLGNTYSDDVTAVHLDALTTVTNIVTGSTEDEINFDQAAAVDLGSMKYYSGGDLSITTKTGGTLDVGALTDTNTAGTLAPFTFTVAGPASLSLTNFKGDALASTTGSIVASKVANLTIKGFGGAIDVNSKVDVLTVEDAYSLAIDGATDLEEMTVEGVAAYGKAYDAKSATNKAPYAKDDYWLDITIPAGADDLAKVTLTGNFNVLDFGNGLAELSSFTMNATASSLELDATPDLATVNLTGSKINTVSADSTGATSLTLDYTYRAIDYNTATDVATGTLSVESNVDLTSLTVNADDIGILTVVGNTKLATISFPNLNSIGTTTAAAANIYNNDLTAVKATDTYQADITSAQLHTTTDTGTFDAGTSGMKGLQAYLDAIVTKGTTATNAVFFDNVTTEVIGGATTAADTTTTPGEFGTFTASTLASEADNAASTYAVLYLRADGETTTTSYAAQVVGNQVISYSFQTNRNANTLLDTDLGNAEGFTIGYANGLNITADDGDTDTDAANGASVQTIDDLVAYLNAEVNTTTSAVGTTVEASRAGGEQTYYTVNYLTISGTGGAVATASAGGQVNATFGSDETGTTLVLSHTFGGAFNESMLASALMAKIDASNLYNAATVATADGRSNRFVVTRNISQTGYGTVDKSPLAVDPPALTILEYDGTTLTGSSTVQWAPNSFTSTFGTYSAYRDNAAAIRNLNGTTGSSASAVVDLYVSKSAKKGITVRLKNTGTVAFSSQVSMIFAGGTSNTAIVAGTAANTSAAGGGLLVDGTNVISSSLNSATTTTDTTATVYWVASYASLATGDGTPSSSTSGDAAVTCDRTSWLG